MRPEDIANTLYKKYWRGDDCYVIRAEAKRACFHYVLCKKLMPDCKTVCDIGGGWGAFAALCGAMDLECTLVDDFMDRGHSDGSDPRWDLSSAYGFRVLQQDILHEDFSLERRRYDVITFFDVLEHLHNSPKKLLQVALDALKPGGLMVVGVPNCVNLLKRLRMIMGTCNWSPMEEWYDTPIFRSHVREPSVSDLHYIARDLDLKKAKVFGRNWAGLMNQSFGARLIASFSDNILRLRPSLCSNLYLTGFKAK
jgi:SAM-dependent methyltransferase